MLAVVYSQQRSPCHGETYLLLQSQKWMLSACSRMLMLKPFTYFLILEVHTLKQSIIRESNLDAHLKVNALNHAFLLLDKLCPRTLHLAYLTVLGLALINPVFYLILWICGGSSVRGIYPLFLFSILASYSR